MVLLGPLVIVGIITAIVLAVQRATRHGAASPPSVPRSEAVPAVPHVGRSVALSASLDRWVAADLLSADQAVAILDHERSVAAARPPGLRVAAPAPRRRIPVFAEALGYLGGVLALTGLTLLVANYWPDLATSIRLTLSLVATLALVGSGALVNEHIDPALARLRWFLWTVSSATAAVFTGVLIVDELDVDMALLVVAACAGTIALESGVLWWWRERPIQELLFLVAAIVSAGACVGGFTNGGFAGLTVWLLAALVLAAGLCGVTPQPIVPHVVGTIAILVGASVTSSQWVGAGLILVTATVGGLLLPAALPQLRMDAPQRVVLLVVAGLGATRGISTIVYFAGEAGGMTGLVTWAIGGIVMAVGARRLLRAPIVAEIIGGLGLIGGAALTGTQWPSFAPLFGLGTALTLLVIGMLPGRVFYSLLGSVGLLINVPWTISRFFPGEGRAPLLILVSGALIIVVAVLLARQGDRFRTELKLHTPDEATTPSADVGAAAHRDRRRHVLRAGSILSGAVQREPVQARFAVLHHHGVRHGRFRRHRRHRIDQ